MTQFERIHDPGLQQERTAIAWDRTGLALIVAAGVLERSLGGPLIQPLSVVAAGIFLLGLSLLVLGRSRYLARWQRIQEGEPRPSTGFVVTVAAATATLGAASLFVVLDRGFN